MKQTLKSVSALAATLITFGSLADAAVIVTLPTATTTGSLEFTTDISFTVTTAGGARSLTFDEWVTNDGSLTSIGFPAGSLGYTLNGGSLQTVSLVALIDNRAGTSGSVTPNDGSLTSGTIVVALNDVVTVKAATYIIPMGDPPAGYNPQVNQTFTGNVYLTTGGGTFLAVANSSVPEPSCALLLLGGLGTLASRRRRK